MGIAHGHGDGGMDEDSLQTENVATGHHVVAVEDVSELPTCVEATALEPRPQACQRPVGINVLSAPNLLRSTLNWLAYNSAARPSSVRQG